MRRPVLLLLLCAAVLLCAWPALTGDPLLDDLRLVPLRRPFPRADVFAQPPRWQPAVELSFRAVAALSPQRFVIAVQLHHLASLALHLLAVWLLLRLALARHPGDRVHPWHALVLGAFALHPSLLESYGHLAARGEAISAACLAGLALSLHHGRAAPALALTLLGMAASPGFAPAAAALGLAAALEQPSTRSRRTALAIALTALLSALLTFGARPSLDDLLRWSMRVPRAVSIATRALVVPTETALRLPHWELSLPMSSAERLTAALPLLASVFLWRRQARGAAVLVLGAALSVLPLARFADSLAYGFDRYLAGAAVLLAVAVLREPAPYGSPRSPPGRSVSWAGAGWRCWCCWASWRGRRPRGSPRTPTSSTR
ncbi:MAG: hypothetical protein IPF99_01765 [Deltaproteobacteria bacterium]|nr:hypothetical protein [Deltaproteobacteria bacterium]